jgi:thiamine biosynthesis lipoprotein
VTRDDSIHTQVLMDTRVAIQVPRGSDEAVAAAFEWFHQVEACCSRFDARSELRQLCATVGVAVPVTTMLFQAVQFALMVADQSGGAFDPTVGHAMEGRGFNRDYRTGQRIDTSRGASAGRSDVSYRDVHLDAKRQSITLARPLMLDLGAVAKGLAVDMAAHQLRPLENFAIDAGGDLYLGGRRPDGEPWSIGIRSPRRAAQELDSRTSDISTRGPASAGPPAAWAGEIVQTLRVCDLAVCTSGDYARRSPSDSAGHHIIDPRSGASPHGLASVTVVAQTAMVADAVATAAFVLGPADGLEFCERLGVDALMLSSSCERYATRGMLRGEYRRDGAILPNSQGSTDDRPGAAGRDVRAGRGN